MVTEMRLMERLRLLITETK